MTDNFYRAFEDRHRGSRELIKERQQTYLPFVQPWLAADPASTALDLGCGRGEWLELLNEEGFRARGIDLDEGMLEACHTLGLDAEQGDALTTLRSMSAESLSIVSAFHLVEHIDFEMLVALVREALRVLRPGGILILETPNPENLIVAGCNFYLDPSHKNPIPPELLSFVVQYAGFTRLKQLRLQESKQLNDPETEIRLLDVLGGVSPDYAVIAQKACDATLAQSFNAAFSREYGLSLVELAARFEARFVQSEDRILLDPVQKLRDEFVQLNEQIQKFEERVRKNQLQLDAAMQESQAEMRRMLEQLQAVYSSTSWRLTMPLRWGMDKARTAWRSAKPRIKPWVKKSATYAYRYRWLRQLLGRILWITPDLRQRVVDFMVAAAVQESNVELVVEDDDLTPRARCAYDALLAALASRNKKEDL